MTIHGLLPRSDLRDADEGGAMQGVRAWGDGGGLAQGKWSACLSQTLRVRDLFGKVTS